VAENSWPFYGSETTEAQFSKWARNFARNGIISGLNITPGAGMQISVSSGSAIVQGLFYENTTSLTRAIATAPGSGSRVDKVVLRLDQTANTITVAVTSAALVQNDSTWEFEIGTVTVTAGAASVTTGMISEPRPSIGLRAIPYSTSKRPTPPDAVALGIDTDTKRLELWIGGAWVNLSSLANMAGVLPVASGGTGKTTPREALEALGAYIRPTAPAIAPGRLWIPGAQPPA
jgi:hypothetical protein